MVNTVVAEQIEAMIGFLESHQELALGHCSRTTEGRSLARQQWVECAQILNSVAGDCPRKSPTEWRTFYVEYKSKVLKKIRKQKREQSAIGGGWAKKISLTPLQERLYTILGCDMEEPLPGVHQGPSVSHQPPMKRCRKALYAIPEDRQHLALEAQALEAQDLEAQALERQDLEAQQETVEKFEIDKLLVLQDIATGVHELVAGQNRMASALESLVDVINGHVMSTLAKNNNSD